MKIGFVTTTSEKLNYYFPTSAEPDFIPVEPPFTPDDQLAVDQLRLCGFHVIPIVWGSLINSLRDFNLIIVRSPWDYMDNDVTIHHFMNWIHQLELSGLKVCNSSAFMHWMLDKHYLQNLSDEGISIIPTRFYEQGSQINLSDIYKNRGEFILKPCISAAGFGLFHVRNIEDAQTFQAILDEKLKNCSYMEQDFIPEITENGEWSLVFFCGKYSHAVHKKPAKNSILVHAERGGSLSFSSQISPEIIDFSTHCFSKISTAFTQSTGKPCDSLSILYLRIDVIETKQGPVVIECEGVEPELFFRARKGSEVDFCEAIQRILT